MCSIKAIVVVCVLALGLAGTAHAGVGVSSAVLGVGNPLQGVNAPPNGILLLTVPSSEPFRAPARTGTCGSRSTAATGSGGSPRRVW